MPVRFTRWTTPVLLAAGVWAGFGPVSAEPDSLPRQEPSPASTPAPKSLEQATLDPAAEDGATEDTLALGGDPIESSSLLPVSGFS